MKCIDMDVQRKQNLTFHCEILSYDASSSLEVVRILVRCAYNFKEGKLGAHASHT